MTKELLEEMGYLFPRQVADGEWIALFRFVFTWGLVKGLDDVGYNERWCYSSLNDALVAVANWDGEGDPPGNWIVNKPSQRQGPGATAARIQ
jgi:hypothetical protein